MPNFHFERDAVERVLARLDAERVPWHARPPGERLVLQREHYLPLDERFRYLGVSEPPRHAKETLQNLVGVFVPGPESDPRRADRERWRYGYAVVLRDPTDAERAACPFGRSVIRTFEAIDVITGAGPNVYRPFGIVEHFVVC